MKKDKDRRRGNSDRRSVNLISAVLSVLLVVLAAQLSDGKGILHCLYFHNSAFFLYSSRSICYQNQPNHPKPEPGSGQFER